jgi:hypothetical protein
MSTLPFTSEEDWESLEVDATDTRRYHARAILELRTRIEALEAARSAPDQQAAAAESESQLQQEPGLDCWPLGLPRTKDAGRRVEVLLGNGDVVEGRLVHVGYSHPCGEYGMPQPLFDVVAVSGLTLSLCLGSRWRFVDDKPAQSEPSHEPQPEADQPAADSPFKPGQLWWMRSRRVVKITSVENYHERDFCITFADYPFDKDTLLIYYRLSGEAILDTTRNYDLIELFSGSK